MKKYNWSNGWKFYRHEGTRGSSINLPHCIRLECDSDTIASGKKFRYVKKMIADEKLIAQDVVLEFEGIACDAKVNFNGVQIGGRRDSLSNFYIDLTGNIKLGENIVEIVIDASAIKKSNHIPNIAFCREVYLHKGNHARFVLGDLKISLISVEPATIKIETAITSLDGNIKAVILKDGRKIASGLGYDCKIKIPDAKFWSAENPELYELQLSLINGKKVFDKQTTKFGLRPPFGGSEITEECCIAETGLVGKEQVHQAVEDMKQSGYNTIICPIPLSYDLLETCDETGMYIVPQILTDELSSAEWRDVLRRNIYKNYNHPSVIAYKICTGSGNEVLCNEIASYFAANDMQKPVLIG